MNSVRVTISAGQLNYDTVSALCHRWATVMTFLRKLTSHTSNAMKITFNMAAYTAVYALEPVFRLVVHFVPFERRSPRPLHEVSFFLVIHIKGNKKTRMDIMEAAVGGTKEKNFRKRRIYLCNVLN